MEMVGHASVGFDTTDGYNENFRFLLVANTHGRQTGMAYLQYLDGRLHLPP